MEIDNTNFSNTNPALISAKTFSDLNKIVIVDDETVKETKTLISTSLNFYKKYIQPNIIPIIIIVVFITFIIYRYMTSKKDDDTKKKKKTSKNKSNDKFSPDILTVIGETQLNQLNQLNQPNQLNMIEQNVNSISQIPLQTIDNVIDTVIKQNEDILDDDDIYELMEEKSNDDNLHQENNYINFASSTNRNELHEANKKIFS